MLQFFALYGNPVAHSLSPLLHNYAFKQLGIDALYGRILLHNGTQLYENFKAHHLSGANITVPFKEEAFRQSDEVRGIAKDIGACNTWVREGGQIIGYNTDAQGFYDCIKDYKITNALILGAGGSAKAVAMILKAHNIRTTLLNRSIEKLHFFRQKGFECFVSSDFSPTQNYDIIINTTSAGLNNHLLPCSEALLRHLCKGALYAFELIYGKQTPFLHIAKQCGLICADGGQMLINQAALAFALFCGDKDIKSERVAKLMREIW